MTPEERASGRAQALRDPASPQAQQYARTIYLEAWGKIIGVLQRTAPRSDAEKSCADFSEAISFFELNGPSLQLAKALRGFAISAGVCGRKAESHSALRRAVSMLEPGLKNPSSTDPDKTDCVMKCLRGLAEGTQNMAEALEHYGRGLKLLDRLEKDLGASKNLARYRSLFYRAAGSAHARLRPKKLDNLLQSESFLRKSLAAFASLPEENYFLVSKIKSLRELARTLRSLSRLTVQGNTTRSALYLQEAEETVLAAAALNSRLGSESQWDHYHLAKILRNKGDKRGALLACLAGVQFIEAGREELSEDENKISFLGDSIAVYDLGICLAHESGEMEAAFNLSQRCKARVFLEALREKVTLPPHIPDSKAIATHLGAGDALIEYHVGRHAVSIFTLTSQDMNWKRTLREKTWLEDKIRTLHGFIRQRPSEITGKLIARTLDELSELLIKPALEMLPSGCRNLIIVPSGPLSELSFAPLPGRGRRALIEDFNLSFLPSGAMISRCAPHGGPAASRSMLALADPFGDLWHSGAEAQEVSAIFPGSKLLSGDDATKAALNGGSEHRYIHIACHGEHPEGSPCAHLRLAPHGQDDGILRAQEIMDLSLKGVDLVFLSCCKSDRIVHKGADEFEGLQRAFLHAGSRSVVSVLWDIEDAATRKLVTAFYNGLAGGRQKSEALREAQLQLLNGPYAHPYYWAAFKLLGSPS